MRHIFIINPSAGKTDISVKIREEIETVCTEMNIEPLICISEYPGYEREMTEKMCSLFSNEEIRFYSIGGSGTLFYIVSGIKDFEKTEVACCPYGLTNDLLKSYGKNVQDFRSIKNLINGKVDKLDLIETCGIKTVDFACFGIGTTYFNDITFFQLTSLIHPLISYGICTLFDILRNKCYDYNLTIDGKDYSGKYSLVVFFNGMCMGGKIIPSSAPRPNDGYFDVIMMEEMPRGTQFVKLRAYSRGELYKLGHYAHVVRAKKAVFSRKDKNTIALNCDGEGVRSPESKITVQLLPDKLKFVVPQSAQLLPEEPPAEENRRR